MTQSRLSSLIEACVNIVIGFAINWVANLWILPRYGYVVTGGIAFEIGLWFTAISLVRSYTIRRWFNARLHSMAQRLASTLEAFEGKEPPMKP